MSALSSYARAKPHASIVEIFSSFQGEGIYAGYPQIFIRFEGCNMHCAYCDTAHETGRKSTHDALFSRVAGLERKYGPHHSVAITGGEPLLRETFLRAFLPRLKREGFRVYLETNATLPSALMRILPWCDIIAADIKLPSVTGQRGLWAAHARCIGAAVKKKVFVKVVVNGNVRMREFQKAVRLSSRIDSSIPFVIQPVTVDTAEKKMKSCSAGLLRTLRRHAQKNITDVRIMPQMHIIAGVR